MFNFADTLDHLCARPHLYVGTPVTLREVWNYLLGYQHGWHEAEGGAIPLEGMFEWMQMRFVINETSWGAQRMLLHAYGSDANAIAALPVLYREFVADRAAWGMEGIAARRLEALRRRYGKDFGEPESTTTTGGRNRESEATGAERRRDEFPVQ
jgi:hypothetical protein